MNNLQLSTIGYYNPSASLSALRTHCLQFPNDVHSFNNLSEYNVFAVKPACFSTGNKELATIGVRASVCHRENASFGVFQFEVLVVESWAVDGSTTGAVMISEVTTLAHEAWNNSMETAPFVAKPSFTGTESSKVLCSSWYNVAPQLHHDTTHGLAVRFHVEENAQHTHLFSFRGEGSHEICKRRTSRPGGGSQMAQMAEGRIN